MRVTLLLEQGDVVGSRAVPVGSGFAKSRRGPLTYAIDGQNSGFLKRRAVEGTGCVRHMMIAEQDLRRLDLEVILDIRLDPQFLRQPDEHGVLPDIAGTGKRAQGVQQNALKLDK